MTEENDAKYLFPAYPIMHCGIGKGSVEFPLSKVLGSWGLTIRDIHINDAGEAYVLCYGGVDGRKTIGMQHTIMPLSAPAFEFHPGSHYLDLILRYNVDEQGDLSLPKWIRAIWMNFSILGVVDVVEQGCYSLLFNDKVFNTL